MMKSIQRFGVTAEEHRGKKTEQTAAAAFHTERILQECKFEATKVSSNTPQGNDEYEQRVAEEANLNIRGMIAEAAYFMAEQRGFAPGQENSDWLKAEIEVETYLRDARQMPQSASPEY